MRSPFDYIPATLTVEEPGGIGTKEIPNPDYLQFQKAIKPSFDYIPATVEDEDGGEAENPAYAGLSRTGAPTENSRVQVPPESSDAGETPTSALTAIRGIGDKSAAKLVDAGIDTLTKLAEADPRALVKILGVGYNVNRAENDILQALELINAAIEPEG